MSATSPQRLGLLRVLLRRRHRFRELRAWSALGSIVLLAAVPLLGLGRIDVWGGGHRAFGEPASGAAALFAALLFGLGCYLVTFIVNAIGGRLFCGFGCPFAQANRLAEATRAAAGPGRSLARVRSLAFAILFAGSVLLWWIDPRVLFEGSAQAVAITLGAWLAGTLLVAAHARWLSWTFCRGWCPVGLYYQVVAPRRSFEIRFRPELRTCVACNACDRICPVGIAPRDLAAPLARDEGLAIAQAPALNHCLSCGDCVEACEHVLARRGIVPVPLAFAFRGEADRAYEGSATQNASRNSP